MEYIVTNSGNRIHRQTNISCQESISILGNSLVDKNVELRGNAEYKISIGIGKYCYLNENSKVVVTSRPISMGNYVFVDSYSVISSQNIGNRVLIGRNCQISGVIGHCCIINDNVEIFSTMVIPDYSYVTRDEFGEVVIEDLNYSYKKIIETDIKKMFIIGVTT